MRFSTPAAGAGGCLLLALTLACTGAPPPTTEKSDRSDGSGRSDVARPEASPESEGGGGSWQTVVPEPDGAADGADLGMQTVHAVLLPSGKVLLASGSSWRNLTTPEDPIQYYPEHIPPEPGKGVFNRNHDPFHNGELDAYFELINSVALYDPDENSFYRIPHPSPVPDPHRRDHFAPNDFFCTGHLHLPDGNVLFAGGTEYYYPARTGLPSTFLFDWRQEQTIDWRTIDWRRRADLSWTPWTFAGFMARGRWYPHMVPLLDGRLVLFGGFVGFDHGYPEPYQFEMNHFVEIFDPAAWDPARPDRAWCAVDVAQHVNSPYTRPVKPFYGRRDCSARCIERTDPEACIDRCMRDLRFDAFKLYPNNYLLPDGRIYLTREGEWVSLRTPETDFMRRTRQTYFMTVNGGNDTCGPETVSFTLGPERPEEVTSYGSSFHDPTFDDIVILGGQATDGGVRLENARGEEIQFAGSPAGKKIEIYQPPDGRHPDGHWTLERDFLLEDLTMHYPVLLPTKQVLVLNGGGYDFYAPVLAPTLLTPVPGRSGADRYRRVRMAPAVHPRLYHNIALLLPDARVLVAGGNTSRATVELATTPPSPPPPGGQPKPDPTLVDRDVYFFDDGLMGRLSASLFDIPAETWEAEIFSPPYLEIDGPRRAEILRLDAPVDPDGRGPRGTPVYRLAGGERRHLLVGGLPTACPPERGSLVLIKLPAATHGWDSGQRLVDLVFERDTAEEGQADDIAALRFAVPDRHRANLPPGHYMLFYVDCRGKPSKAVVVAIDVA